MHINTILLAHAPVFNRGQCLSPVDRSRLSMPMEDDVTWWEHNLPIHSSHNALQKKARRAEILHYILFYQIVDGFMGLYRPNKRQTVHVI